jgi:Bacterial TSP3 repeat
MQTSDNRRNPWSAPWVLALAVTLCGLLAASAADARRGGCRRDADCDGLTNRQERALHTSPSNADTDHDGLSDGAEVDVFGSDPTKADSDGDGLDDGEEVADGTDPSAKDSDGDGIDDGEDDDSGEDMHAKLVGPLDAADAAAGTVTIFGLTVDASQATLDDGTTLGDLTPGGTVKILLDAAKLPTLVATKIEADDAGGGGGGDDGGHHSGHDD